MVVACNNSTVIMWKKQFFPNLILTHLEGKKKVGCLGLMKQATGNENKQLYVVTTEVR